jgi:hypothetical protein
LFPPGPLFDTIRHDGRFARGETIIRFESITSNDDQQLFPFSRERRPFPEGIIIVADSARALSPIFT